MTHTLRGVDEDEAAGTIASILPFSKPSYTAAKCLFRRLLISLSHPNSGFTHSVLSSQVIVSDIRAMAIKRRRSWKTGTTSTTRGAAAATARPYSRGTIWSKYLTTSTCLAASLESITVVNVLTRSQIYAIVHSRASSGDTPFAPAAVIGVEAKRSSLLLILMTSVSKSDGWIHSSEREASMERYFSRTIFSERVGARSGRLWNRRGNVALSTSDEYAPQMAERPLMTTCLEISSVFSYIHTWSPSPPR
jgi:hypothetical protein